MPYFHVSFNHSLNDGTTELLDVTLGIDMVDIGVDTNPVEPVDVGTVVTGGSAFNVHCSDGPIQLQALN